MTNFRRWLNSLKPEDFISSAEEEPAFKLGCDMCPFGKEACSRNLFEPCDSKLLHWFNEKPRTP